MDGVTGTIVLAVLASAGIKQPQDDRSDKAQSSYSALPAPKGLDC
jgi:hypothetical protein